MLVARHPGAGGLHHRVFADLPNALAAGDLVVVNTSATIPAEVDGMLRGEPIVVHFGAVLADRPGSSRYVPHPTRPLPF